MNSFKIFPSILESVKLAFKHKILWVFALAVTGATYTSQFTFFNEVNPNQLNSNSKEISHLFEQNSKNTSKEEYLLAANTAQVLDESNNESIEDIQFNDSQIDSNEEPVTLSSKDYVFFQALQLIQKLGPNEYLELFLPNLLILLVALLIGLIVAVGVSLIVTSWAYASLIKGSICAIKDEKYLLKTLSDFGVLNWAQLLKLKIWGAFIFVVLFLVTSVFIVSPIVILPEGYVAGILAFLLFLGSIVAFALLHYSLRFGHYFVLLNNQSFKEALISGFFFSKRYFWKILFLEIISGVLVATVVAILLAGLRVVATFGVLYYPSIVEFVFANLALIIPISLFIGVFGSAIMLAIVVFSGFISTYKHILWTKFFLVLETTPKEAITNAE